MLRFKRFAPLAFLLVAAVVAVLAVQTPVHAETHFSDAPEATLPTVETGVCEVGLGATETIRTTKTSESLLSCSEDTIWSVWDMIDEECDGKGAASFRCNSDGSLRALVLACLPE